MLEAAPISDPGLGGLIYYYTRKPPKSNQPFKQPEIPPFGLKQDLVLEMENKGVKLYDDVTRLRVQHRLDYRRQVVDRVYELVTVVAAIHVGMELNARVSMSVAMRV